MSQTDQAAGHAEHEEHHAHACPLSVLVAVFGALMVLTVVTVAIAFVDLGAFNLPVALFVAMIKAALVMAFFMHLYWDSPFNTIAAVGSLGFVVLFISLSILDTSETLETSVETHKLENPAPAVQPAEIKKQGGEAEAH